MRKGYRDYTNADVGYKRIFTATTLGDGEIWIERFIWTGPESQVYPFCMFPLMVVIVFAQRSQNTIPHERGKA